MFPLDPGGGAPDKAQQLGQRRASSPEVEQLEKQLDRTAGDMFRNERDASRKLTEAANGIRDKRIRDKIRYSESMLRGGGQTADVASFDRDIQNNLEDLKNKIAEAASAVGNTKPAPTRRPRQGGSRRRHDSRGRRMRGQQGATESAGQRTSRPQTAEPRNTEPATQQGTGRRPARSARSASQVSRGRWQKGQQGQQGQGQGQQVGEQGAGRRGNRPGPGPGSRPARQGSPDGQGTRRAR